jgi:hypothetical protein
VEAGGQRRNHPQSLLGYSGLSNGHYASSILRRTHPAPIIIPSTPVATRLEPATFKLLFTHAAPFKVPAITAPAGTSHGAIVPATFEAVCRYEFGACCGVGGVLVDGVAVGTVA